MSEGKPCARCGVAARDGSAKSYCKECQRVLAHESHQRRQARGRTPSAFCCRCGGERTGRHHDYCTDCYRLYRRGRLNEPCGRCGKIRAETDRTNSVYCYDCWRGWWLKRKYGITAGQYEAILDRQEHRCAVCRGEQNGRTWHVDHDHGTGHVRGVLCDKCNRGLGHFDEDPDRLRAAADYLERARV